MGGVHTAAELREFAEREPAPIPEKRPAFSTRLLVIYVAVLLAMFLGIAFTGKARDTAKEEQIQEQYKLGQQEGYKSGFEAGRKEGFKDSYKDGFKDGYRDGYRDSRLPVEKVD